MSDSVPKKLHAYVPDAPPSVKIHYPKLFKRWNAHTIPADAMKHGIEQHRNLVSHGLPQPLALYGSVG